MCGPSLEHRLKEHKLVQQAIELEDKHTQVYISAAVEQGCQSTKDHTQGTAQLEHQRTQEYHDHR